MSNMDEKLIKRLAKHDFYYNQEAQQIELLNHTPVLKLNDEGYYRGLNEFYNLTQGEREVLLHILRDCGIE